MTINNKSERNYRGKCLGWPVTSYGAETVTSEDICRNKRNVRLMNFVFQNAFYCHVCHRSLCVIFLLSYDGQRYKAIFTVRMERSSSPLLLSAPHLPHSMPTAYYFYL